MEGVFINGGKSDQCLNKRNYELSGIYGCRKKLLFLLLFTVLFLVVINLVLTLWMIKVLDFSLTGIGPLNILPKGLRLNGDAVIVDKLIASKIQGRKSENIQFQSSKNITLNARSNGGRVLTRLTLSENKLEAQAPSLRIVDSLGKLLFSADKKEVILGADSLHVSGEGGAVFHGSIQTPKVKADSGHELRLESPTRSLDITGTFGVSILSGAGDISATCLSDLKLHSQSGSIIMEGQNIYIPNLQIAQTKVPTNSSQINPNFSHQSVYQICVCQKGRIFLAPPQSICSADNDVCR